MKLRKLWGISVIAVLLCLTGCTDKKVSGEHEAVTILAPFLDCDRLAELVHEKYPEVNLEILSYSGANTTQYLQNMLAADDLPDICTQTVYDPNVSDLSDKMIDLSGYDFTDNYVESRLQDVSDDGAIYMLPSAYSCIGITYNKTLLEEHGWELPESFADLENLAEEAKAEGVQLCLAQVEFPGYGFQYMCNIADTGFLGTFQGKQWQKDYLTGKANVSNTQGMMDCMEYIQKWKALGMFTTNEKNPKSDDETRNEFMEGNTLFLIGSKNGIGETDDTKDQFGLMPYLSEDGSQNVYILNVTRYHGLSKKLAENPQKLEDASKVMEILSSVEGTTAVYDEAKLKSNLLPFKDWNADDTYYGDIADEINAGNTAPLIYAGWENTLVNTGNHMLEYLQDQAVIEDVVNQLDADQDSVVNNKPEVITTTTEVISQESCAKLIGKSFMGATKSDAALISLGEWIHGNGTDQNKEGVNGNLYAQDITESDLCTILPTSWYGTIQTVELTGKEIRKLYEEGYDAAGTGNTYPYVLVKDKELEDSKTYQVVICGANEDIALKDSGIVGMDAAKEFFSKFKTLSEADVK
ncbi:extracellular solute-binding protein [uncultured Eubacterium sp.]|uniref:extracellular solute-binding protein n=1 Tax=uncultured Eubacterium sp. TaxID=165185 RepID=UPI0025DD2874|nr:extracellular solute-binding protein [uncultured Eubacterium sp.]